MLTLPKDSLRPLTPKIVDDYKTRIATVLKECMGTNDSDPTLRGSIALDSMQMVNLFLPPAEIVGDGVRCELTLHRRGINPLEYFAKFEFLMTLVESPFTHEKVFGDISLSSLVCDLCYTDGRRQDYTLRFSHEFIGGLQQLLDLEGYFARPQNTNFWAVKNRYSFSKYTLADPAIVPLLEALWYIGVETDWSCSGHPHAPYLVAHVDASYQDKVDECFRASGWNICPGLLGGTRYGIDLPYTTLHTLDDRNAFMAATVAALRKTFSIPTNPVIPSIPGYRVCLTDDDHPTIQADDLLVIHPFAPEEDHFEVIPRNDADTYTVVALSE